MNQVFFCTKQKMNDLQQEEIEVLKSMYMDDFHELNSESNPHFQIKVGSKLIKKKFFNKKKEYLFDIFFDEKYPKESPKIKIYEDETENNHLSNVIMDLVRRKTN